MSISAPKQSFPIAALLCGFTLAAPAQVTLTGSTDPDEVDELNATTDLVLGVNGTGGLSTNGGSVQLNSVRVGGEFGSGGTLRVNGGSVDVANAMTVSTYFTGPSRVVVENGGRLDTGNTGFESVVSLTNSVTVSGAGSRWTGGFVFTDGEVNGRVVVEDGAAATLSNLSLGGEGAETGQVVVEGSGSSLTSINDIQIDGSGSGPAADRLAAFDVSDGASVQANRLSLGTRRAGLTTGRIDGSGTTLDLLDGGITLGVAGPSSNQSASLRVTNGATVTVGGDLNLLNTDDTRGFSSDLVVASGGSIDLQGNNLNLAGIVRVDTAGGLLLNVGGVSFDGGALEIGSSPGVLKVAGNFTMTNVLDPSTRIIFEINGTDPADYDRLRVGGTADLQGFLRVSLGYAAAAGDRFDILDFATLVDSGYTLFLDPANLDDGLSWDSSAFASTGVLHIVPEPAAAALLGVGGLALLGRSRGSRPTR